MAKYCTCLAVALLGALSPTISQGANPHPALKTYKPASNVVEHSQIVRDITVIKDLTNSGDFAGAKAVYTGGRYSCKTSSKARTLQGFVTSATATAKLLDKAFFTSFTGSAGPTGDAAAGLNAGRLSLADDFWDSFMLAAFDGTGDFSGRSDKFRKVAIQKGALGVLTMYAAYELESGISKMPNVDEGAAHAWDEGWAFYYGDLEDGKDSAWEFTYKRDTDYVPSGGVNGANLIEKYFIEGLKMVRENNTAGAVTARNNIYTILALTAIRAGLKYSYTAAKDGYQDNLHIEAYTYFLSAAGWVAQGSAESATAVQAVLDALAPSKTTLPTGDATYCMVKEQLVKTYEPLGLDCEKVGLYKSLGSDVCAGKNWTELCPQTQPDLPMGLASYMPDVMGSAGSNLDCGTPLVPASDSDVSIAAEKKGLAATLLAFALALGLAFAAAQ